MVFDLTKRYIGYAVIMMIWHTIYSGERTYKVSVFVLVRGL